MCQSPDHRPHISTEAPQSEASRLKAVGKDGLPASRQVENHTSFTDRPCLGSRNGHGVQGVRRTRVHLTPGLAITFEDVPLYSHDDQTVSFQIILSADGTVDIYYGDISIVLDGSIKAYVGITEGDPSKTQFPPETDLVP